MATFPTKRPFKGLMSAAVRQSAALSANRTVSSFGTCVTCGPNLALDSVIKCCVRNSLCGLSLQQNRRSQFSRLQCGQSRLQRSKEMPGSDATSSAKSPCCGDCRSPPSKLVPYPVFYCWHSLRPFSHYGLDRTVEKCRARVLLKSQPASDQFLSKGECTCLSAHLGQLA